MKAIRGMGMVAFALLLAASPASAVTIVTEYIGGTPPANAVGGGDLADIVSTAAHMWASAYSDSFTLHLYYGWAPVGDAGTHTLMAQEGSPNREVAGVIYFDNSGAVSFYLDPTPEANEEYKRKTEEYQDLGGGRVNVARVFSEPAGDAASGTDLLSVALHEIGHAMGMCIANTAFLESSRDGLIEIPEGMPYGGTVIPLARNNAGVTSHFDATRIIYGSVMSGLCGGERRIPSALDILANARLSGLRIERLDTEQAGGSSAADPRNSDRTARGVPSRR